MTTEMRIVNEPKPIPPGDYKVRNCGRSTNFVTGFVITEGEYKGQRLYVANALVPDITLTVTVEEEVTTTERNVVRFKSKREETVFKPRPREGPPMDDTPWLP